MNQIKQAVTNIYVGVTDHLSPEIQAMLMAQYSRDYGTILNRIPTDQTTEEELEEKFGKFYVGYGHKSVGQLGVTNVFFEGVSQLAAKAIENNPLYNGQESSTRYIDFSTQPIINLGFDDFTYWQEKWRDFYIRVLEATIEMVKEQFPLSAQPEGTKEDTWLRTCKARAFDICRFALVAGVTTNVGFSGTFDVLNDHFGEMVYHPSREMRDIANEFLDELKSKYNHSVDIDKLLSRNRYIDDNIEYFYDSRKSHIHAKGQDYLEFVSKGNKGDSIKLINMSHLHDYMENRDKFQKIPRSLASEFIFKYGDVIDFGSYRDIHRHRNGWITMPMLTIDLGMNQWYKDNIPDSFKSELETLITDYEVWYNVARTKYDLVDLQYTVPMGYNVQFHYQCDINQLIYMLELRTSKTVHQTLRHVMQDLHYKLSICEPLIANGIFIDKDKENFTLKRGTQTFVGM